MSFYSCITEHFLRRSFRCVFVSFLLFGSTLGAQGPDRPKLIGELVDAALENNPTTRQAWWNAKRAAATVGIAKSGYYPKVNLQLFATHGREFKYINGPDTNFVILGADLLLSMMLYDFGLTNETVNEAKMALAAANWQTDWAMQKVMIDVLENAYALLHAQEVEQAAAFSVEDADRMLHLAVELNQAGLTPISDVYIAKAAFAQMSMDLVRQQKQLAIQKGRLAASIGICPDTDIELAPIGLPNPRQIEQTLTLIALASEQRADLMAKRAEVEGAAANRAKVRASYLPKISIAGKGGANHAVNDKANAMQYEVTLNLEMPLFTGFDALYQKRKALADLQISRESLTQLELDVALEVLTQSRLLEGAQEMMPYAEDDLNNSNRAYQGLMEIYKAGKERMSAVSEVQRQLAAARVRYSDVKTRWLTSIAQLAYATGALASYTGREIACLPDTQQE